MTDSDAHPPNPEPLIMAPTQENKQSIIILHGRGSNSHKFGPPLLSSPISPTQILHSAFPHTKFIFPSAPLRRAVIYKRRLTHQWFDNWHLTEPTVREDLQLDGLHETSLQIHELLRNEIDLVGAKNVVLWGLSQGCAASLIAMLTWDGEPFGAMVGMCGWLPLRKGLVDMMSGDENWEDVFETAAVAVEVEPVMSSIAFLLEELGMEGKKSADMVFQHIPVFLGHGVEDERVPLALGREAGACLKMLGADVRWREYEGLAHWYSQDMLGDIKLFLVRIGGGE